MVFFLFIFIHKLVSRNLGTNNNNNSYYKYDEIWLHLIKAHRTGIIYVGMTPVCRRYIILYIYRGILYETSK